MNKKIKSLVMAGLVTIMAGSTVVSSSALCKNNMTITNKKGVTYIDANSVLANGGYEPDGIHFGVKGIKKWLDLFIQSANL